MKLAVFTPMPPAPTGVADYSALLLEELRRHEPRWDIEAVSSAEEAARMGQSPDRRLYHVGNSPHHDFLYPYLRERPGVLVLHDLVLHHARLAAVFRSRELVDYRADLASLDKKARARERLESYRREVREAYGETGEDVSRIAIRVGGGRLLYDYPFYEDLVRRSLLTLVHGGAARDEILACVPEARVQRIRMGIPLPERVPRDAARRRLGLPEGRLLLASFGLVTPEKRIRSALTALRRLAASGVEAEYLLVGGTVPHYDALAEARALGVAHRVRLTGRVSDEDFLLYAFASDLCLNLRYPSAGETSATLLRLLACGRPVVVTDQVHVLDFPPRVVARSSLEGEEDGLYCDLRDLLRNGPRRARLAEEARRFAAAEASPAVMASDYLEALEAAYNRGS